MPETVLFVDDNKLLLEIVGDIFRDEGLRILTACSAMEALDYLRREDVAVIVSDNYMPEMNGLELLSSLKQVSPDTVKVLMTAYADLPTALVAINQSEVFRYVLKPWEPHEMLAVVRESLSRHHLLLSMRREDESVLRSLAQAIELKDPLTRGHCDRVCVYAMMISEAMQLPKETLRQIKYGSWLHDCGKIGVSESILNGDRDLTREEFEVMKKHSFWGADVACKAALSEVAQNIIHFHHEHYDGTGYPTGIGGADIPLEARVVAVADVFDALSTDRPYRLKYSMEEALDIITQMRGKALDPEIVDVFVELIRSGKPPFPIEASPQEDAACGSTAALTCTS
jgi:response regulator RpfG family c-di-GMP phosphodiesterase